MLSENGWKEAFDARQVEQASIAEQAAPTVEQSIAQLVSALQESKGWMRDYADSIIRDAIDRKSAPDGEAVEFLLNGQCLKLSFQEVECESCGHSTGEFVCRPIDQYQDELEGAWVALVPAENDRHLACKQPAECKRCAECSEYLKECEAPLQRMQRDQKDMGALLCLLTKEKEKVVELAADRDSADAFSKKLADVCEKAEAQVIALMADKALAEAVIEAAKLVLSNKRGEDDWLILSVYCVGLESALADYQKGVKS